MKPPPGSRPSLPGSGGIYLWVDPTYDVVGVYFGVIPVPETDLRYTQLQDLFTDAVTAAIVDQT